MHQTNLKALSLKRNPQAIIVVVEHSGIWGKETCAEEAETTMVEIQADDKEVFIDTRIVSPAHFLMKIKSFSSLSKHGIQKYESKEFVAGDYKWKLIIYPDGCQSDNHKSKNEVDHISMYIAMAGTDSLPVGWEINAMFNILLYNHILGNYLCFRGRVYRFHTAKSEWGFCKLMSKTSFMDPTHGYLINDNCIFGAEVFVIESKQVVELLSVVKHAYEEKHIWKITNFSKGGCSCRSEEFTAGGCKWYTMLYPAVDARAKTNTVSIYLYCTDFSSHDKVKASYSVQIRDQLNNDHFCIAGSHWFKPSISSWGWPYVDIADMRDSKRGLLVNDCCVVETKVSVQATA